MFPNEVDEDDGFSRIINDQRVKDSLVLYPKRNITSSEKDLVLCLFDITKKIIIEIEGENVRQLCYRTAVMTKRALSKYTVFSELVASNIERWDLTRDVVQQERGRKVYKDFEAEVWGKLMLCEYESKMVKNDHNFCSDTFCFTFLNYHCFLFYF